MIDSERENIAEYVGGYMESLAEDIAMLTPEQLKRHILGSAKRIERRIREAEFAPEPAAPAPDLDALLEEREALLDALTMAYQSGYRDGWEEGPTTNEAMQRVSDALANAGCDPSTPAGEARLARLRTAKRGE